MAANLYLEVEEGIVGEDQARMTVRHAVTYIHTYIEAWKERRKSSMS